MQNTVSSQAGGQSDQYRALAEKIGSELRVAMPGIITAYNPTAQTATVQPAIRERVNQQDGTSADTPLPLLLDCPVMMPRGGGFTLSIPVAVGDECLVIFADSCIDAWWQSGGIQNQLEKRRHDLSDGIVIPGLWSQPRRIVPGEGMQMGSTANSVSVTAGGVTIKAGAAEINATSSGVTVTAPKVDFNAGSVKINGKEVETVP